MKFMQSSAIFCQRCQRKRGNLQGGRLSNDVIISGQHSKTKDGGFEKVSITIGEDEKKKCKYIETKVCVNPVFPSQLNHFIPKNVYLAQSKKLAFQPIKKKKKSLTRKYDTYSRNNTQYLMITTKVIHNISKTKQHNFSFY